MLYLEIGSYFITEAGLKVVAILTQIFQMLALQVGATELGWLFLLFFFLFGLLIQAVSMQPRSM